MITNVIAMGAAGVIQLHVNIELAECYTENQQRDKAIVLFETALAPGIRSSGEVRQALKLVELYQTDRPEKGVALLERVKRANGARPLVNEINFAALKLADELMNGKKEEKALQAYQNLRKKDEVLATLKEVSAEYERSVNRLSALVAAKSGDSVTASAQLDSIRLYAAQTKAQIEQLEKEQNYDAIVFFRISRCFAQLGRFWESRLGFQWLYENFKDFEDRPVVLYLLIYSNAKLAPGTAVELTIATLPLIEVPALTGKYLNAAKTAVKDTGLELGDIKRVEHEEHGENYVLRQDPAAGAKVPFGTVVNLTVVAPN